MAGNQQKPQNLPVQVSFFSTSHLPHRVDFENINQNDPEAINFSEQFLEALRYFILEFSKLKN